MGVITYRQKNTYLRRCDKCQKPSHYIYNITLGQFSYNLCSGFCADAARREYEYKAKNGISPNNPDPIEDAIDIGGDSFEP